MYSVSQMELAGAVSGDEKSRIVLTPVTCVHRARAFAPDSARDALDGDSIRTAVVQECVFVFTGRINAYIGWVQLTAEIVNFVPLSCLM